ncbi:multidrug transporter [Advenella kashmirensis W13003]|uniref:Multidrug transporter MdfA n=2 Tax=Advenella kashmirensis TaxID=310575 RepID=V8QUT1_9BURK|nr:multidrug transporter [Advenella kashmirensis W13003]
MSLIKEPFILVVKSPRHSLIGIIRVIFQVVLSMSSSSRKPSDKRIITLSMLLFPLAMVLFELSAYIGNDMVQPAMLTITAEYGVDDAWVASSMSLYILGGACLTWLIGPLSDRYGRRPVMLWGVLYFIAANFLILLAPTIEWFMFLRFLQGMGLCFIAAVGYVSIQEAFEELTAIRVMALMANISMVAPLLGPLAGAALISVVSWHWGFVIIASLAGIGLIGLFLHMPETVNLALPKQPPAQIWRQYKGVLKNGLFMQLTLYFPLIVLPMLVWIGLSPVFLIKDMGMTNMGYGLSQLPIFISLIIGNLMLARYAPRFPVGQSVYFSIPIMIAGGVLLILGGMFPRFEYAGLVGGLALSAFAQGITFAVLYRFTLMASDQPKGVVAAVMSLIMMLMQAVGIELFKLVYVHWGLAALCIMNGLLMLIFAALTPPLMRKAMRIATPGPAPATPAS